MKNHIETVHRLVFFENFEKKTLTGTEIDRCMHISVPSRDTHREITEWDRDICITTEMRNQLFFATGKWEIQNRQALSEKEKQFQSAELMGADACRLHLCKRLPIWRKFISWFLIHPRLTNEERNGDAQQTCQLGTWKLNSNLPTPDLWMPRFFHQTPSSGKTHPGSSSSSRASQGEGLSLEQRCGGGGGGSIDLLNPPP